MIKEAWRVLPPETGRAERVDYEYKEMGRRKYSCLLSRWKNGGEHASAKQKRRILGIGNPAFA